MQLLKSEKARDELASKQRVLSMRERSTLFLADGIRTRDDLIKLVQGDVDLVQKLVTDGYLLPAQSLVSKTAPASNSTASSRPAPLAPVATPSQTTGFTGMDTVSRNIEAIKASSDSFEGKRSLATTRMFLFDIVERMFSRKMPDQANHFRDQLRSAKDRESMLAIARDIIINVEEIAGHERADGLSERLAMILPPE